MPHFKQIEVERVQEWLAANPGSVPLAEVARHVWGFSRNANKLKSLIQQIEPGREILSTAASRRRAGEKIRKRTDQKVRDALTNPGAEQKGSRELGRDAGVHRSTISRSRRRQ